MNDLPYTVEKEDDMYVVEGPKIEKMLGYTNLDSERDLHSSRNSSKILVFWNSLKKLVSRRGDTVRMYGLQFDYYK